MGLPDLPAKIPKVSNDWASVFKRNGWRTFGMFCDALAAKHPEAIGFVSGVKTRESLKKVCTEVLSRVAMSELTVSYRDRLFSFLCPRSECSPEVMRIANVVYSTFASNVRCDNVGFYPENFEGVARMEFRGGESFSKWYQRRRTFYAISRVAHCLFGSTGKRRGLLFWGPASSGKSLLTSIISACCPDELVGKFTMQGSKSTFWFQTLLCKAFYVGEEIQLDNNSAQALKLLLEGSRSLVTDVKFSDSVALDYRPTVVTSNEPCFIIVNHEKEAFLERAFSFQFLKPQTVSVSNDRVAQATAWALLCHEAIQMFPIGSDHSICDSSFVF